MSDIIRNVEDLSVFRRAYALSLDVHKASLNFPKIEQYALADQVRRASKSVCVNLAEGFAKQRASSQEFKRYLLIAIGSCDEMQIWLQYCGDLGYLPMSKAHEWKDAYKTVAKMLTGLKQKWQ